jgi:hypothetical protein
MCRAVLAALGLVLVAGCSEEIGTPSFERVESKFATFSERDREQLKWVGYQTDQKGLPDDLILGVVTQVAQDYKSLTLKLDNPKAKIEPGDVFMVYMRLDDYDKAGRRAETDHHDFRTARVLVTKVDADVVTAKIDHYNTDRPEAIGDRALARAF